MPVYEYRCPQCKESLEVRQTEYSPLPSIPCPHCRVDCPKLLSTPNWKFSPFLTELCAGTMV